MLVHLGVCDGTLGGAMGDAVCVFLQCMCFGEMCVSYNVHMLLQFLIVQCMYLHVYWCSGGYVYTLVQCVYIDAVCMYVYVGDVWVMFRVCEIVQCVC